MRCPTRRPLWNGSLLSMPRARAMSGELAAMRSRALRLRPHEPSGWTTACGCFVPGLERRWCRPSSTRAAQPVAGTGAHQRTPTRLCAPSGLQWRPHHREGSRQHPRPDLHRLRTGRRRRRLDRRDRRGTRGARCRRTPTSRTSRAEPRTRSDALNHGLSVCTGDLIARLDADDWAFPTRLERQVAEFHARPELVLCGSPYERRDADGGLLRIGYPSPDPRRTRSRRCSSEIGYRTRRRCTDAMRSSTSVATTPPGFPSRTTTSG